MVELNGDGQGSDNGSHLPVRFLGRLSQKSVFCPISVVRWDKMPKEKKQVMWDLIEKQCEQNAKNRKKLEVSHASGSKNNARRGRQMEQKLGRPVCRSEVILSTLLKKDDNFVNEERKILADKILEHLPEDQELAISYGVPLKILAHLNDVIEKVFGSEHSGRVHGLGGNVCPSKAFGVFRNHNMNLGSSSSISRQRVEEDLEK
ncbi:uncharacterized protein LOC107855476 [Capsicum annuum]|uniref:uncharacterized protein LOC107855476 n=1 Tax=Capsicum annuum TaxID=4072 RepID=UPI001FB0C03F|nr:uncharacterized protein LOC107855476 [Capsicum annuum]